MITYSPMALLPLIGLFTLLSGDSAIKTTIPTQSPASRVDNPKTALPVPNPRLLVFSKTTAFRHDSIETAVKAIKDLGTTRGMIVQATEDATVFNKENLKNFDCVVFALTTGDVLNPAQQTALEEFVEGGKGWVGIHSASDTEYEWPWYANLVGAYFKSHPANHPLINVTIENRGNASTSPLPPVWKRSDEWYDFRSNPRSKVTVLASLLESDYKASPADHPITWCHDQGAGRAWYTGMGHDKSAYAEPDFLNHLYGGILWASQDPSVKKAKSLEFKTTEGWSNSSGVLDNSQSVGKALVTKQEYGDSWVHAEFNIPKGSNSGVYLQGRYEIQILDSFKKPTSELTFSDCGAVYQQFNEKTQKGWDGNPPLANAFAGPGEWNRYDILFRAPRFKGGKKIENAKFVEVRLNGVKVQENIEVTGPTRAAMFSNEKPKGPIMFQGDHGPIQYRNLLVLPLKLD